MVFCTDLGAALLEEQISALKEALAAKQAALQELGKDPQGLTQLPPLSPGLALISPPVLHPCNSQLPQNQLGVGLVGTGGCSLLRCSAQTAASGQVLAEI